MRDSDTYLAILDEGREKGLEEGRIDELRKMILRLGQRLFGVPEESVKTFLTRIEDVDRLERLLDRTLDVKSWQDLLATP